MDEQEEEFTWFERIMLAVLTPVFYAGGYMYGFLRETVRLSFPMLFDDER